MKIAFTFLLFMCCFVAGQMVLAQNSTIVKSASVEQMLNIYAAKNKSQETVRAWKIQVGAFNDRREMEREKSRFENIFPYHRLEWIYDNPYYILKMKDAAFKEKIEALSLLHRIKRRHPSAILILDDVNRKSIFNSRNF